MLGSLSAFVTFELPSFTTCSGSRFHLSVRVEGTSGTVLRDFSAEGFPSNSVLWRGPGTLRQKNGLGGARYLVEIRSRDLTF